MKKAGLAALSIMVALLVVDVVSANGFYINEILEPFGDISIGQLYLQFSNVVDFFITFIIFAGIAKFALKGKYGESSKSVAVVSALILAFAFALFEVRTGFNFGELGYLSMTFFCGFLLFFIYSLARAFGAGSKFAIAILYIITYAMVGAFFPEAFDFINYHAGNSFGMAVLRLLLHVILIVAVVKLIISAVTFKNKFD